MNMNKYTKKEIEEMAAQAAEVEIYFFTQPDRYIRRIHTDNIRHDCNVEDINDLPEEFNGKVVLIDEEEYNRTILANASESADFEEWYGDKDAKVLVVAISYENE